VEILGGVRYGRTTGAPVALAIPNKDAENWEETLAAGAPAAGAETPAVTVPRPGHADLGGALLYDLDDLRDVIERASARETAAKVASGAVAKALLEELDCRVVSHVTRIAGETAGVALRLEDVPRVEADPLRCADPDAGARMRAAIDTARNAGDTVGGVVEVVVFGYPPGVGTYAQGDRRLQSRLAQAVFGVPAIKGLEFGLGFAAAALQGSEVHDAIAYDHERGYRRVSNRAGGVEGGISSGEPIVVRAAMKPIATLRSPLPSVDMGSHAAVASRFERSDVCAVPAAGVVLEAVVALALADAALERFGGATVDDLQAAVAAFLERCGRR
jgi:chorismate synthase